MSVTNITSQTNGSSSDSHAKANPGDSAVLVNYLPSEHVATGLEYNSLIRFVTSSECTESLKRYAGRRPDTKLSAHFSQSPSFKR